jgi:DNA-directed RNA polymerase subunit H (RpoH/RPB5)
MWHKTALLSRLAPFSLATSARTTPKSCHLSVEPNMGGARRGAAPQARVRNGSGKRAASSSRAANPTADAGGRRRPARGGGAARGGSTGRAARLVAPVPRRRRRADAEAEDDESDADEDEKSGASAAGANNDDKGEGGEAGEHDSDESATASESESGEGEGEDGEEDNDEARSDKARTNREAAAAGKKRTKAAPESGVETVAKKGPGKGGKKTAKKGAASGAPAAKRIPRVSAQVLKQRMNVAFLQNPRGRQRIWENIQKMMQDRGYQWIRDRPPPAPTEDIWPNNRGFLGTFHLHAIDAPPTLPIRVPLQTNQQAAEMKETKERECKHQDQPTGGGGGRGDAAKMDEGSKMTRSPDGYDADGSEVRPAGWARPESIGNGVREPVYVFFCSKLGEPTLNSMVYPSRHVIVVADSITSKARTSLLLLPVKNPPVTPPSVTPPSVALPHAHQPAAHSAVPGLQAASSPPGEASAAAKAALATIPGSASGSVAAPVLPAASADATRASASASTAAAAGVACYPLSEVHVESFESSRFMFDLLAQRYLKTVRVTPAGRERLGDIARVYDHDVTHYPRMMDTDPIASHLALKQGSVVELDRMSVSSAEHAAFRVIARAHADLKTATSNPIIIQIPPKPSTASTLAIAPHLGTLTASAR